MYSGTKTSSYVTYADHLFVSDVDFYCCKMFSGFNVTEHEVGGNISSIYSFLILLFFFFASSFLCLPFRMS